MPFSSVIFLFGFLPIFLVSYQLAPARCRNAVALVGSLLFYAWGAPRFLPVLILVSAADFMFSRRIAAAELGSKLRSSLLTVAVCLNLALLFYFKYANFVVHEGNRLATAFGTSPVLWENVVLPMGISFVAFEEISYLVDVFRGTAQPAKRLLIMPCSCRSSRTPSRAPSFAGKISSVSSESGSTLCRRASKVFCASALAWPRRS